jgi:TrpR-related protein YerC/YecD
MTQTRTNKIWQSPTNRDLISAISSLKSKSELRGFLRDLMTESEILELSARWQAARMLSQNIPYTKIIAKTGLSSTTVARVQHWLKHGTGGYRLILDRQAKKLRSK